jgi:PncC family amidohydrolase
VTDENLTALAERLQEICLGSSSTVAAAESCTGGLVATAITEVAGSSGYFLGSIVAYADSAKASLLDVGQDVLASHGAVSAQAARAMAMGARERFGTTFAVSVTGVAGPGGGSDAKPVGLTYVGLAGPAGVDVRRHHWTGDRASNRFESARAALELLVEASEAAESATRSDEPAVGSRR